MKSEMIRISEPARFKIHTVEVDVNHIHLLADSTPEISPTQIVRKLKQESTVLVWIGKSEHFGLMAIFSLLPVKPPRKSLENTLKTKDKRSHSSA